MIHFISKYLNFFSRRIHFFKLMTTVLYRGIPFKHPPIKKQILKNRKIMKLPKITENHVAFLPWHCHPPPWLSLCRCVAFAITLPLLCLFLTFWPGRKGRSRRKRGMHAFHAFQALQVFDFPLNYIFRLLKYNCFHFLRNTL